jgi:glutamate/tyrosine decarboxylase-like PLP-dependent enzyme
MMSSRLGCLDMASLCELDATAEGCLCSACAVPVCAVAVPSVHALLRVSSLFHVAAALVAQVALPPPPPQFDLSDRLRERGWVVPAYSLAKGNEDVKVMRVVCRWGAGAGGTEQQLGRHGLGACLLRGW